MKRYTIPLLTLLCLFFLVAVMMEDPFHQGIFNLSAQNVQNRSHSIERVSADIEIYTIPVQQLENELVRLLNEQDNSSYLNDNPQATCTIYQIAEDQLQITISPNGDGLGLDMEPQTVPFARMDLTLFPVVLVG